MTTIEAIILGVIGSVALWKTLRHLAPALIVGAQQRLASVLTRPTAPSWLRRYGNWLRPPLVAKPTSGCGSGCSACSGCAVARPSTDAQPLLFRRMDPPVPRS